MNAFLGRKVKQYVLMPASHFFLCENRKTVRVYPVLTRPFFFLLRTIRRTVPYCGREFFRASVKTRNSLPAHHGGRRLWPLPSPMARRHLNQAHRRHPNTMGDAACAWFGLNPPGGRLVSTRLTRMVRRDIFFLLLRTIPT
jgi:hypothetical protein